MAVIHRQHPFPLVFRAGRNALASIRRDGLAPGRIGLIPGAAGGPKALGIAGLDKAIFGNWLLRQPRPRLLLGASVGAWRFASLAQPDPVGAIGRFCDAYVDQHYPRGSTRQSISAEIDRMLQTVVRGHEREILDSAGYRLNILTDRCHGWLASDRTMPLLLALAGVIAANTVGRRHLGHWMERVICHDPRAAPAFVPVDGLPTRALALNETNLEAALLASGSIPLVMNGVSPLPGAQAGVYRDGGLLDYHFDLPLGSDDDLVLYPHFFDKIVPGWFDKFLPWRKPGQDSLSNMLMVAPSATWIAALPHGKNPDRGDFRRFIDEPDTRRRYWRQVIAQSERLGDAFLEVMAGDDLASHLQPF